ncbi:hypothetical protein HanXRQr2_Chr16g0777431 [Helianthus annuus]|uniref:Uncharacterized protein n=1 Tax=Helianthus annuus TaxID=4232 RepID=A0A251S3V2_HELAN|nr:uncharacterized protein LOC110915547 [Helianthus annuus]KAF5762502.1 hypothetical protein HanXRQr2_Chr16g0777431 [Helianthus annuus]KAJ0642993.1 hypothetical protein HanLR1_Chr16g0644501 [Helianthus annuus]KAJ0646860.1 hypothetical protein HanOQP8_Chr16g0639841 [Helianthus annuus]
MEDNVCGVNHLDSDVLLPPRKRLLACLKRQNSDMNGDSNSNNNPDSPSTESSLTQLDARISYLLKAHLSNDNPSEEEIVAASRAAAEVAVKVAIAARAAAQEKAVIAAKAMAAAKKALELVENVEDGQELSSEQQLRKSKTKKQVDVQMLYDNKKPMAENGKANDKELARKLHHAINSSPRISKCGVGSDVKNRKHKKLKTSDNGVGISPSYVKEVETTTKSKLENGSKAKSGDDDVTTLGRKRGRMKQKKLPLSICHHRDQATPKEDVTCRSPLPVGPSGSERGPLWKCKAFKAPVCVKQNKVMQL